MINFSQNGWSHWKVYLNNVSSLIELSIFYIKCFLIRRNIRIKRFTRKTCKFSVSNFFLRLFKKLLINLCSTPKDKQHCSNKFLSGINRLAENMRNTVFSRKQRILRLKRFLSVFNNFDKFLAKRLISLKSLFE